MANMHRQHRKLVIMTTVIITVGILVGLFGAGFLWWKSHSSDNAGSTPTPDSITVQGEYVCLPKHSDGPHTLECAFGIKTDDGTYYGLRLLGQSGARPQAPDPLASYKVGERLRVTGTLHPGNQDPYASTGLIEIASIEPIK